jgi:ribosome biogenesis GTPase
VEDLTLHAPTAAVGRRPDLAAELAQLGDLTYTAARVLAQHRGRWLVVDGSDQPPRLVAARGRMRAAGERIPTTGDWVALDGDGVIAAVLERRGTVVRRAAGAPVSAQVLAANIDVVFLVSGLDHDFNPRRIERYLVTARDSGAAPVIVLSHRAWQERHPGAPDVLGRRVVMHEDGVAYTVVGSVPPTAAENAARDLR